MSLELIPNGFIKLGASQTMVRPRLDQERVTQDVAINIANIQENNTNPSLNPVFSSTGGNVALRPYQSTNTDMSLEKYFRSEEHTSELQSLMRISYAVFCLNKKTTQAN